MQSFRFEVGESGFLSEPAAAEQAGWYASRYPALDPLDFEAHIMLVRASASLRLNAPFQRRGGLTRARYNLLRILYMADGNRSLMSDIVAGMHVSPTSITKLVDSLEHDGYVRRADNVVDKRKVWVELLPAGAALVERMLPEVAHHVSRIWQGLSREEKRVLVHLLAKLRLDILTHAAEEQVGGMGARRIVLDS